MKTFAPFAAVLTVLLLLPFGCGPASGTGTAADDRDHHLEHHVPEHKPHSYAHAVTELRRRFDAIHEEIAAGHSAHVAQELDELRDVINWLPELAADSDLRKAQWDIVKGVADELAAFCARLHQEAETGRISATTTNEYAALVARLEPFVEQAGNTKPWRPDDHHHDHDHHDHAPHNHPDRDEKE
jgi:hypothetical protein